MVGRNKKKVFAEIKDRVWKRVQRWRRNLFSPGGRKVLIKVVLQAILSYLMSVFQVSNALCGDLQSIML